MKKISILINAAAISVILMIPAFAYIDPSVTTYAIQAIAGIVVAVGAAAGILWRRAKKKAQETFGLDLESKKETEADVVAFEEDGQDTNIQA